MGRLSDTWEYDLFRIKKFPRKDEHQTVAMSGSSFSATRRPDVTLAPSPGSGWQEQDVFVRASLSCHSRPSTRARQLMLPLLVLAESFGSHLNTMPLSPVLVLLWESRWCRLAQMSVTKKRTPCSSPYPRKCRQISPKSFLLRDFPDPAHFPLVRTNIFILSIKWY